MRRRDIIYVGMILLVFWGIGSLFYDLVAFPPHPLMSVKTTGVLHYQDSYLSDGYNYTDYMVVTADGSPSFMWTFSCTHFHDGSVVDVSHAQTTPDRAYLPWPILWTFPPDEYAASVTSNARGC